MVSNYRPILLQIAPIPRSSTKRQHARLQGIVSSLAELGYDSVVCTYPQSKVIHSAENLHTQSKNKDIRTHRELEESAFSTHIKLILLSIKTFQRRAPVAIHAYSVRGLKMALVIKLFFFWKKVPVVCDLSEADVENIKNQFSLTRPLIKLSSMVLCPTQRSLETIQKTLNLDSNKASLVVNGINSHVRLGDARIETIHEKLKIGADKTVIVVNEELTKTSSDLKELTKIIHSFKKMKDHIHFLVIGEPQKYLYSFLKKYELRSMCSLVGDVSNKLLPQYYSASNIALSTGQSNNNDMQVKILNFMASGLSVVCYKTKLTAQYLPESNPFASSTSELSNSLKDLHHNKQWQSELGSQNRQRFEEFYSWEVSKEQLHATYTQVFNE